MQGMDWVIEINNKLNEMTSTPMEMEAEVREKRCIFKVAPLVKELNEKAYKPQVVSFGPYHHGEEHLKPVEQHKHRVLLHFLKRSDKPLESYVESLVEVVQDLKDSYDLLDPVWIQDTSAFLQLMVLDGCFIIEILRVATNAENDYAFNDPIFGNHGMAHMMPLFKCDMVMLENQLPMLVFQKLVAVRFGDIDTIEGNQIFNHMVQIFWGQDWRYRSSTPGECLHLLDANRKSMVWRDLTLAISDDDVQRYIGDQDIFRSATQLSEAGIRFINNPPGYLIGFYENGVLFISGLTVDDTTETMLLNLIALEQYQVGSSTGGRNEVNSFIFFMNMIIFDARDVSLLCSNGIIKNRMGNDEAVVKLFKSLAKGTTLDPKTRAGKVYCMVVKYYQTRRRRDNPVNSMADVLNNLGEMPTTTVDMQREMEERKKRSIYKVAPHVTEVNNKAYKPQVVSFGPYHHGEEHLRPMEEHKRRALHHVLKRSNKTVYYYYFPLLGVIKDVMDSYEPLDPVWKQNENAAFWQMMILDGCFMLEILRAGTGDVDDYAPNDPIFSNHGKVYMMPFFKHDMLMLENQLPLSVLYKLLALEKDTEIEDDYVNKLILKFCGVPDTRSASIGKCLHILDVYRKSMVWEDSQRSSPEAQGDMVREDSQRSSPEAQGDMVRGDSQRSSPEAQGDIKPIQEEQRISPILKAVGYICDKWSKKKKQEEQIILSATRLSEAGILFKKSRSENLTDMSFHRGALELPPVVVDDTTESMFLNQIAFERYHVGAGDEVSSYIFFMNSIIYDAKDVSLLHSIGIIRNALGNEEAVVKLFNLLAKDITLNPKNMVYNINSKVEAYCKKPWNRLRAKIVHNYITSPWPILFAANLLFVFSIIQTVYTIYGVYYKK